MGWHPVHPPEVRARVEYLIQNTTMRYAEISRSESVPWQTVSGWAKKLPKGSYPRRVSRNEPRIKQEQIAQIVAARQGGMEWQEVAKTFGVHETTVRKFYKREVPVEPAQAPPPAPAQTKCPTVSLVKRLRRDGWDEPFIASVVRNIPRLSVAQVST